MVKSADKLAFITGNDKYLTGVEGSFPVLVKSVREEFCCFRYRHSYACLWREEQTISGKLDRHCRRDRGALIVIDTILIAKFSELEYLLDCSNWNTHHCMWFSDQVWRRPSFGTAGPLGGDHPLVTKEGHHVLDVIFTTPIPDLGTLVENHCNKGA